MTEVITSRAKLLAGLLAIVAMMALIVFPSFAYAQSASEHVSGTQSYDSSSDAWTGGTGAVDIVYDTSGGTWQDPGTDPTDDSDNVSHANGTYIITLPKLISYTGMNIGAVNTSDSYTVNVRGAIESGKKVFVTAETNKTLSAAGDAGIVETTTQGKTEWTTDECMGTINTDGSLSGTNSTDTIALSGVAKVAGDYVGYVQYNATVMSDADETSGGAVVPPVYGTEVQSWDAGATENAVTAILYDSGTLVVSGQGAMKDFGSPWSTPWYESKDLITSVVVEDGITRIGNYAFAYFYNMDNPIIADSVTAFGTEAFKGCRGMTNIALPNNLTTLGQFGLAGCTSLTSVVIPSSVKTLNVGVFQDCTGLTSVVIPNGVLSIMKDAFKGCTSLTSVNLPESITNLGNSYNGYAFRDSSLTTINCGFAEGAVAGAPWGATNATVNYNYTG